MRLARYMALIGCLWLTGLPAAMGSDSFPSRPLTMLLGFNPGGSTDMQAQVLAEIMAEELGQPVELLYYQGQGGGNAAAMLAASQDGGHVFQYGHASPFLITPLISDTSFALDSYRFVAGVLEAQFAFVTGPDTPFSTWDEMIAYGREQGELTYATQSPYDRFVIESIMREEGIAVRVLPTTGGASMAPMIINGDAHFGISGGTHTAYTDNGDMRLLASPNRDRLMAYPEVPTLSELGYAIEVLSYRVLAVPADTPEEHVIRLSAAAKRATEDQRFIEVAESRTKMPVVFVGEEELNMVFAEQVRLFIEALEAR
ncbi:MAG: tripartite tricarboxylate transporter substrate binding protein [Natronospirillum sp.]|uniref:tripartite tricarboxylate transporter substrate binding protein n=1 Tax=Natronospirillum sp. TaxID=2812955 RepID=UPI0025DBF6C7|nr:tripartite tricarboxylate transporter substrate binding protein [Natronospirillum sp.]MCH8552205.1 tripartite tricarboxylate transporter substrate binding protein [Natronospirillum sp.]